MVRKTTVDKSPRVPVKGKKGGKKQAPPAGKNKAPPAKKTTPPPREQHTRNAKTKTPNYATGLPRTEENKELNKKDSVPVEKTALDNNQNVETPSATATAEGTDETADANDDIPKKKHITASQSPMIVNYLKSSISISLCRASIAPRVMFG